MAGLSLCLQAPAFAAIATDGTLGPAGSLVGPNYAIPASLGSVVGNNLFHSFSTFNINTGESATFSGPGNVSNIIARVTGGTASTIDGGLNSTIPQANLVLINPSGIVFGPNASLNVSGSFHATTADYVRLADGGLFDATTPSNSVLTTAPLSAFGFIGPAAPISMQVADLAVPEGKTLSLIGGDITFAGSLTARGGQVNLAAVAASGEVGMTAVGVDVSAMPVMGNIAFTGGWIDVSEGMLPLGGGAVYIRGGNISLDRNSAITSDTALGNSRNIDVVASGTFVIDGGLVQEQTWDSGNAGNIVVNAGTLTLSNGGLVAGFANAGSSGSNSTVQITAQDSVDISGRSLSSNSGVYIINDDGSGLPGHISVNAATLNVSHGAGISGDTTGSGRAATIDVHAKNSINLVNGNIYSNTSGSGSAGDVTLFAPLLNIDGGLVQTLTTAGGNGGTLSVDVGRLSIVNGGQIDASSRQATGRAGSIQIKARDSVSISGTDAGGFHSMILSRADGAGNAGVINIDTNRFLIGNGGQIQAGAWSTGDSGSILVKASELNIDGGTISSVNYYGAKGGLIDINVGKVTLVNAGKIDASTFGDGIGGDIKLVGNQLDVNGGIISSKAEGKGNGGNIEIQTGEVALTNAGKIDASSSGPGWGGGVSIKADSIDISSRASILANASGDGGAGVVWLRAPAISLDGGYIRGSTEGAGPGGLIWIEADRLALVGGASIDTGSTGPGAAGGIVLLATSSVFLSGAQVASTTSQDGSAGLVAIDAGNTFISESSLVTTDARRSDGGGIELRARDMIYLNNSEISATVGGGMGNGGDIYIDPQFVVLNNSKITANAFGGNGGNINLLSNNFFKSANSTITASSRLGLTGTVTLNTQFADLSGSLANLPMVYLDTAGLIRQRCAAQLDGKISTFVMAGRGGIHQEPGGLMPSMSLLPEVPVMHSAFDAATQAGVQYASLPETRYGCVN